MKILNKKALTATAIVGITIGIMAFITVLMLGDNVRQLYVKPENIDIRSNFESLSFSTEVLINDKKKFSQEEVFYSLGTTDDFHLIGFDFDQFEVVGFGKKIIKPSDCFEGACLCLFSEKGNILEQCQPFGGKVRFFSRKPTAIDTIHQDQSTNVAVTDYNQGGTKIITEGQNLLLNAAKIATVPPEYNEYSELVIGRYSNPTRLYVEKFLFNEYTSIFISLYSIESKRIARMGLAYDVKNIENNLKHLDSSISFLESFVIEQWESPEDFDSEEEWAKNVLLIDRSIDRALEIFKQTQDFDNTYKEDIKNILLTYMDRIYFTYNDKEIVTGHYKGKTWDVLEVMDKTFRNYKELFPIEDISDERLLKIYSIINGKSWNQLADKKFKEAESEKDLEKAISLFTLIQESSYYPEIFQNKAKEKLVILNEKLIVSTINDDFKTAVEEKEKLGEKKSTKDPDEIAINFFNIIEKIEDLKDTNEELNILKDKARYEFVVLYTDPKYEANPYPDDPLPEDIDPVLLSISMNMNELAIIHMEKIDNVGVLPITKDEFLNLKKATEVKRDKRKAKLEEIEKQTE